MKQLLRYPFVRHVLTLSGGTLAASLLGYLFRPILTRLFPPEAFGIFGTLMALVQIAATAASGRYEDAIMLPEKPSRARYLLHLSWLWAGGTALACGLISLPLARYVEAAWTLYLPWFPVLVLLISLPRITEVWLSRHRAFPTLARGQLIRQSTTSIVQTGLGWQAPAPGHLFTGAALGYALQGAYLLHQARKITPALFRTRPRGLLEVARRYRNFPRYTLWANLLNALSGHLPTVLLVAFFSPAVVGYYHLAYLVLALPITLLGSATARVFFVEASEARRNHTLPDLTRQVLRGLLLVGGFPLLALLPVAPDLFALVFGASWHTAGLYSMLMVPWMLMLLLTSPMTYLLDLLERQHLALRFTLIFLPLRLGTLVLGGLTGRPSLAILCFSLASAGGLLGYLWLLLRQADLPGSTLPALMGEMLRMALPSGLLLVLVPFMPSPWKLIPWVLSLPLYARRLYVRWGSGTA